MIDSSTSAITRARQAVTSFGAWAHTDRGALTVIGLLTAVALGLRLWHLDTEPLHVDEIRQVTEVQDTWIRVIRASWGTQQPPLDYLIGKAVVSVLPATDFVQRLPAALAGTGTVWLLGLVLVRAGQPIAAGFAAFFVAISPLHIEMSQYARPYALPVFMVVATIAVYQRWQQGRRGWRTIALFTVVAALALIARASMPMLALAVLGGIAVVRAIQSHAWRRPLEMLRGDPLAFVVLPVLFLAVWVPNSLKITTGTGNLTSCFTCDKWARAAQAVENFGVYGERGVRPTSLAWLMVICVAVLAWPRARRALSETAIVWAPLLLTAPLFTVLHAIVLPRGDLFAHRFMVFLPVGLAAYLGVAVTAILVGRRTRGLPRHVGTVVVGVVLVVTAVDMVGTVRMQAQTLDLADWKSTAAHIESIEQPGDVIVSIDARPFSRGTKFGFRAAPRYYDGTSHYWTPEKAADEPERVEGARRYHFVLFVPKYAAGWSIPDGWSSIEFSEMLILTTSPLVDEHDRLGAWWEVAEILRPDVSVATLIAGGALQHHVQLDTHPFFATALSRADAIGQADFAEEEIDSAAGEGDW